MPNVEKLELLADVIEWAEEAGHWNMGTWGTEYTDQSNNMEKLAPYQECGFAACAAGWTLLIDGWELYDDSHYRKDERELVTEFQIGVEAAEILDIEQPWVEDWRDSLVAVDSHLFFWTSLPTYQIVDAVKHLAKGDDMADAYLHATGFEFGEENCDDE